MVAITSTMALQFVCVYLLNLTVIIYVMKLRNKAILLALTLLAIVVTGVYIWNSKQKADVPPGVKTPTQGTYKGTISVDNCNFSDCPRYSVILSTGEKCNLEGTATIKQSDDSKVVKITGTWNRLEAGPCIVQVSATQFE